jgi:hypothetical protein
MLPRFRLRSLGEPWCEALWRRSEVIWAAATFERLARQPSPKQAYDRARAEALAARLLCTASVWH